MNNLKMMKKLIWPLIGFRNTVIHEYFGIDKKLVWDTLKDDLTFVKEQVSGILQDLLEEEQ